MPSFFKILRTPSLINLGFTLVASFYLTAKIQKEEKHKGGPAYILSSGIYTNMTKSRCTALKYPSQLPFFCESYPHAFGPRSVKCHPQEYSRQRKRPMPGTPRHRSVRGGPSTPPEKEVAMPLCSPGDGCDAGQGVEPHAPQVCTSRFYLPLAIALPSKCGQGTVGLGRHAAPLA